MGGCKEWLENTYLLQIWCERSQSEELIFNLRSKGEYCTSIGERTFEEQSVQRVKDQYLSEDLKKNSVTEQGRLNQEKVKYFIEARTFH